MRFIQCSDGLLWCRFPWWAEQCLFTLERTIGATESTAFDTPIYNTHTQIWGPKLLGLVTWLSNEINAICDANNNHNQ